MYFPFNGNMYSFLYSDYQACIISFYRNTILQYMNSLINKLISLNTNRDEPFVISIFGETASGKTTFLKNLFDLSFPLNRHSVIGSPYIIQIQNSLKESIEIRVTNANETRNIIFDDVSSMVEYLKNYGIWSDGKILEEIIIKLRFCYFNQPLKIIDCNYFIYDNDIEVHISHERLRSIISASNLVLYCMEAERVFSNSNLSNIVQLLSLAPKELDLVVTHMDIIRFNDKMNGTHDEIEFVQYCNNAISSFFPDFTGNVFFGK